MKKILAYLLVCLLPISFSVSAQQVTQVSPNAGRSTSVMVEPLEKDIPQLMKDASIPGLSVALVHHGKLVWRHHYGVQNADTREPVNDETIFEAASLTKVVTAYTALKLVDEGKLNLDTPLNKYLGNNYEVGNDARINLITARRVLTHTSGFPNWRPGGDSALLPINFDPGEKFSYSGEGFVYLSKVIEHITGTQFDELVKKMVFEPLGMKNSSLVWLDSYGKRKIYRHDWLGKPSFRWEGKGFNAAASMHTTAEDYAKFLIALMKGTGLKKRTWTEMFTQQVQVNEKNPGVYWGLGVGLEVTDAGKDMWHWGDQGDSKCYFTAFLHQQDAVVYFTNSKNGLSIVQEILDDAIGGNHPAITWLNYGKADPALKGLYDSILVKGAATALTAYREQRGSSGGHSFSESNINQLGYKFLQMKKVDDAIGIFRQNTVDFPQSSNVWDSLAEAYMTQGNKELAIEYYEKSLSLDPTNTNAAEQLKKLKS